MIDIETTPEGATLVSVNEPLDYGVVADLAEVLASDSVRASHHVVIELVAPGSMDESAVGVLVRSARDMRLRGGRLTLCGADDRVRDALERIGVSRLVQLADDAGSALDFSPHRLTRPRWYSHGPGADSSAGRAGDS